MRELTFCSTISAHFLREKVGVSGMAVIAGIDASTHLTRTGVPRLIRNCADLGPYSRAMPRALWGS